MSRSTVRIARLLALSLLFACPLACATRLAPPEIAVEETDELSDELAGEGLDVMRAYVSRLRVLSDPLRLLAADQCGEHVVPYLGVTLEITGQVNPTPLERVRKLRGIDINPTVVSVLPNSPAARAGMLPGDVIRSVNGKRVISYGDFSAHWFTDSRVAPRLQLKRGEERIDVQLAYQPACTGHAILSLSGGLATSHHYRKYILVSQDLMDFVRSDDELVILIAHQLAHVLMDYRRLTRQVEQTADRLSLELALRAGYDIREAVGIWQRIAVERPWMITTHGKGSALHGHIAARTLLMPEMISELEAKYPGMRDRGRQP